MNKISASIITVLLASSPAHALDYMVDFTRIKDLETIRPLVEQCGDFGAMEHYRQRLETAANLEDMRASLVDMGFGMFNDCPEGIAGPGITPDVPYKPPATLSYTVDFTRLNNFEDMRPLVEGCKDFGALEPYRDRLTSSANLEEMSATLRNIGFGMFNECPENISGKGIKPAKY